MLNNKGLLTCIFVGWFCSAFAVEGFSVNLPSKFDAMATPPISHQYASYNVWANKELALWLGALDEQTSEKTVESSFSSIKKTIAHIWSAEFLWLKVLKGESYQDNPAKQFQGTLQQMLSQWIEASEEFENYILAQSTEELSTLMTLGSDKSPVGVDQILQHTLNHSTYHRGQLITMGRQLGLQQPPRTDFIHFIRL
jgi:uncharacterized damage-inducible protein DinB